MSASAEPIGPLRGLRVLEIGGIGPNPFVGMLLADMGAHVIRLGRAPAASGASRGGRRPGAARLPPARRRPQERRRPRAGRVAGRPRRRTDRGVPARGDGTARARSRRAAGARLVYGRITGYGQRGPLSQVAGHDINYISLAGALGASRRLGERPLFALNLVGDYGGGAMFPAFGVVCALLEARTTGRGQVIDAARIDGAALLTTLMHGLSAAGSWDGDRPDTNLLDSGAPFYEVYACADDGHVAVGAIEPPVLHPAGGAARARPRRDAAVRR